MEAAGIELSLETAGVVVALTFVASPFYIRQAMAAFASVDPTLRTPRARSACPRRALVA